MEVAKGRLERVVVKECVRDVEGDWSIFTSLIGLYLGLLRTVDSHRPKQRQHHRLSPNHNLNPPFNVILLSTTACKSRKIAENSAFVQARPRTHAAPINRQSRGPTGGVQWEDAPGRGPAPSCFSGDTQVETANGPKLMRDLQVGESVLVPSAGNSLRYERIAMFYHREPETRVKFVRLQTEHGKVLALTGEFKAD